MKHYAITGRVSGDDEDTLLLIDAENDDAATAEFIAELRSIRNLEEDDEREIFLGAKVWSNTPIFE